MTERILLKSILRDKISEKSKKNTLLILCLLLGSFTSIFMYLCKNQFNTDVFISICSFLSLLNLLIFIICIYNITGSLFTPTFLFLLSFYFFQNGWFILHALGLDYNTFYFNTLKEVSGDAAQFAGMSNIVVGLSAVIMSQTDTQKKINTNYIDRLPPSIVRKSALIGFCLCGVIAIPLVLIKFFGYALPSGYYAVREFEERIPSYIVLLEYLYMPFGIFYLVFSKKNRRNSAYCFLIVWLILTALCGDRTTGAAGLLTVFYMWYRAEKNTGKRKKNIIWLILMGFLLMVFIQVSYAFRLKEDLATSLFDGSIIISFISELGFSCFPLFLIMNIVPSLEPFQKGRQYFLSLIGGVIPSNVDFNGVIAKFTEDWNIYDKWIDKYYNYDFGVGFSLNAEAYMNWGWLGLLVLFVIGLVIFGNLSIDSRNIKDRSNYKDYKAMVLLFMWLTLARRSSYYIWNSLFWCVLFVPIFIRLMSIILRKRGKNE